MSTAARVLIIEDEKKIADWLGTFLEQANFAVIKANDGRTGLALAEKDKPDVVLLDEPFSALDSQTRLAIADEVVDVLRAEGKTVILVTHDIGEAIAMTDRVIVLSRRPGRIRSEYRMHFETPDGKRPTPFVARGLPEFNEYFNLLWKELDVHVEG